MRVLETRTNPVCAGLWIASSPKALRNDGVGLKPEKGRAFRHPLAKANGNFIDVIPTEPNGDEGSTLYSVFREYYTVDSSRVFGMTVRCHKTSPPNPNNFWRI